MKQILTTIILIMTFQAVNAQLDFTIERITVSGIVEILSENVLYDEDFGQGPHVYIECSITNNSNDIIILCPNETKIIITFRYNQMDYDKMPLFTLPFKNSDKLIILPNQTINFGFGDYLILGTDIMKNYNNDYIKEMLEILPTIKVRYKDKSINIVTNGIKNVTVGDIPYIYK
jgi:hypothetical protein